MEQNQELMFKLSMFEQQMRQLQEQMQAVEQGIVELSSLDFDLKDLENSQDKEIFAPVGRGIFIKAKVLSDELTVDIGNRNFVKKTVPETQNIIKNQISKLEEIKDELNKSFEGLNSEIGKIIEESEKQQKN